MGIATAQAAANIAFIKYWGAKDLDRVIPSNRSISMTLSACTTRTTVETLAHGAADRILARDSAGRLAQAPESFSARILAHLDRVRALAGVAVGLRVATENRFPAAAGLASSASGFAALSLAATAALGIELEATALSDFSRRSGSGSAARSALGGYVEWPLGFDEGQGHATVIAPAEHWDLCDLIAIVDAGEKAVSSLEGHRRACSSPHFSARQVEVQRRIDVVRSSIARRDLATLGPVIEEEAIELHLIAMSSRPPIFYWRPSTLDVLEAIRALRGRGIGAWSTLDAGPNVHVICEPADALAVNEALAALPGVTEVIRDRVGTGPRLIDEPVI